MPVKNYSYSIFQGAKQGEISEILLLLQQYQSLEIKNPFVISHY